PQLHRRFARLLLRQGHPTLALEVAARGLEDKRYPNDPELLYCRALALVNSRNTTRADQFVQELLARPGLPDAIRIEALSLAGRIRKDRAGPTPDPARRRALIREPLDFYQQAYEPTGATFPGINAAPLALLTDDAERSRALAARVRDGALDELERPGKDRDYWLLATLGE